MERKKTTLKDYYESLPESIHPKREFLIKIMQACNVSATTANNWAKGENKPRRQEAVNAICELMNSSEKELWP